MVATWSHLSVVCPLQIPIPMSKKKNWVQQVDSSKIIYCFCVLPIKCVHYTGRAWAGGTFLRQQKSVPPAHAQQVWLPSPPWIHLLRMD
jgi:hypothetical protein